MDKHLTSKILIVEDEIIISDYIFELLQEEKYQHIKIANNQETAANYMKTFLPDIILMDINLNGQNTGIELSKNKNKNATVIFITGQLDFALIGEAIETKPDAYLTKPIKKIDLLTAIKLASLKNIKKHITIKDGHNDIILFHDDIVYIKSDNSYIDIYCTTKKHTCRNSLDHFLAELNNDFFCKTHRSYIINKKFITKKTSISVFLGTIKIPISRNFQVEF